MNRIELTAPSKGVPHMQCVYDELRTAGARMGYHESDLYVRADGISRPIISAALQDGRLARRPRLFQSQHPDDNGAIFYEIAFGYAPFWRERLGSTP